MSTPQGRYQIIGFETQADYDDFNRDVASGRAGQTPEQELMVVYATDDIEEAKLIMRNGGFFRNEGTPQQTWVVAREGRKSDG